MKNKVAGLLIMIVMAMSGNLVQAQEKQDENKDAEKKVEENDTDKKVEEKDTGKKAEVKDDKALEAIKDIYRRLDIGVKIYMDWTMKWGQKDSGPGAPYGNAAGTGAGSGAFDRINKYGNGATALAGFQSSGQDYREKNNNGFNISRAYLDIKYKINDILIARLTTDVDAGVSGSADANAAFHIFLKYAYLEAKKDFGPVWISATGGLIEMPIIGLIDKISDYRWIQQNYIDQSKIMLNGRSFDNSADLGVKASFGVMKYLTLTGAFSNGTGYKANENNSYKAVTYLATVNPIKEIYINGFGRNEITGKLDYTGKNTKKEYYGYGVAYMSDLIKAGFNHIFPYETTVGLAQTNLTITGNTLAAYPVKRSGFMLFDSWLNFNLGAIVEKAPLLVTGRFVYGLQRGTYQRSFTDSEFAKTRNTFLYALGVGWTFNKNFRILLGGEIEQYRVKKNQILSAAEAPATSPSYYSVGAPATSYFTGSRNPHDTKRVYIKTELVF